MAGKLGTLSPAVRDAVKRHMANIGQYKIESNSMNSFRYQQLDNYHLRAVVRSLGEQAKKCFSPKFMRRGQVISGLGKDRRPLVGSSRIQKRS